MTKRIRLLPLALCGALIVLGLTGCAGGPAIGSGAETPDTGEGPPAGFTDRPMLPSCGSIELHQGETIPPEALECLADGGAGGAELRVTSPTVEGDPIVTYYRALPSGGIEVFTDMTQDAYGGGWAHDFCEDATAIDEHGLCTDAVTD